MKTKHFAPLGGIVLLLVLYSQAVFSQCPLSFTCIESEVICDLNDLDGFQCANAFAPTTSFPLATLCRGNGVPLNVTWFAFIGNGQDLILTIEVDGPSCANNQGIQAGIFERFCDGSSTWDCDPNCQTGSFSLSGITKKWETYYMWINGCNQDVCEFSISVNGSLVTPPLPDTLLPLVVDGALCPGGEVRICYPLDPNLCSPQYTWSVNQQVLMDSNRRCLIIQIEEDAIPGSTIDLGLTVGIGNPYTSVPYCDSSSQTYTSPPIPPIEIRTAPCQLICEEDLPFPCTGTRSGNSCSLRVIPVGEECLVDSIYPITIIPRSGVGRKDTFICTPGLPYTAENGQVYTEEVCGDIITFGVTRTSPTCPGESIDCDTSYILNLGRFKTKAQWTLDCKKCSSSYTLCPNVIYDSNCPTFLSQVTLSLKWYNASTGEQLGTTGPDGCQTVTESGKYCVDIQGVYRGTTCLNPVPECFDLSPSYFIDNTVITEDTVVCRDSIATYSVPLKSEDCLYRWRITEGSGQILTPNFTDSSTIRVKWTTQAPDTNELCISILSNCIAKDVCFSTVICKKTTSTVDEIEGQFYFDIQSSILNGRDIIGSGRIVTQIFNANGVLVKSQELEGDNFSISCQDLNPGWYAGLIKDSITGKNRLLPFVIID